MKKTFILLFGILTAFTAVCQVPAINDIVRTNTLSPTRVANALDAGTAFTAAGTDTYTVAVGLGVYSGSMTYEEGDKFTILFTNANTGTSPTININSEGAKDIVDNKGSPVAVGDVEGILNLWYDGTDFRIVGAAGGGGSGTLTSVGLTLGTSGTDAGVSGSPLTIDGSITLNLPSSSASNRGLLTSADWSTFNAKSPAAGSGSLTTTGTLTSGSTGTGFTIALESSTVTGTLASANGGTIGVHDLFIPASAFWPRVTGGCSQLIQTELATSLFNIQSLDFDQTTDEFAQFQIALPRKWNHGTVTATIYWTAPSGSGTVQWEVSGGAYSNDDALTVALGTAIEIDDTLIATNDLHITSTSSAITLAGTPTDADFLAIQIARDPDGDTLSGDAKFLGMSLRLTTDASVDE